MEADTHMEHLTQAELPTALAQSPPLFRGQLTEPIEHDGFPEWSRTVEAHGLTLRSFRGGFELRDELYAHCAHARWVVDGDVNAYLAAHRDGVWPIPDTYSTFSEWTPYLGEMDGTLHRYGYGIGRKTVERALRILTGGGHYRADDYTIHACGTNPWVLEGPEGTLLCNCDVIGRPNDPAQIPETRVETPAGAITVEEENPMVLAGIERFAQLLADHFDRTLVEHTSAPWGNSLHGFRDDAGEGLQIDAKDLATLGGLSQRAEDVSVYGGAEVPLPAPFEDRTTHLEWTGPEYEVGESPINGPVVGYQLEWESKRGLAYWTNVSTYTLSGRRDDFLADRFKLHASRDRLRNVEV